ncbi:hypothetical protein BaRGS_00024032 [Batillaria attramentaria]|uniref:Doubled CXXCH motif domain-containing protein n=1 Tax=Batillaria attramentaria TaxID=370345 RepID=A0ABD0KCU3_9CAEN
MQVYVKAAVSRAPTENIAVQCIYCFKPGHHHEAATPPASDHFILGSTYSTSAKPPTDDFSLQIHTNTRRVLCLYCHNEKDTDYQKVHLEA